MDENKGQNNRGHNIAPYQGNAPLNLFTGNPHSSDIYRKSEKIITALYMVTGFLSDTEPLKWRVRSLGSDLLALSNMLKDTFSTEHDKVVYDLKSHIMEVSSLLDIAKFAGLISPMNAGILTDEIHKLENMLDESGNQGMQSVNSGSLFIDRSFFDDRSAQPKEGDLSKGSRGNLGLRKHDQDLKGQNSGGRGPARQGDAAASSVEKAEKKEKRRAAILSIIRKKGQVTIKDVSLLLPEVSEKTTQRELLSLVEEGVLKKEGERRWSKYSLI